MQNKLLQEKIAVAIATHIEGSNSPFERQEGGSGHITDCRKHYVKLAKKVIGMVRKLDHAPDWGKAPEDATYTAQDRDGTWHWFKEKPSKDLWDACWFVGLPKQFDVQWKGKRRKIVNKYWQQTLSRRPRE